MPRIPAENVSSDLPLYLRFRDLVAKNIVSNWTQLGRLIDHDGFPPGRLLSANTRAWSLAEVQHWLATRPTERKVVSPPARPPRARKQTGEADASR